MDEEEPPVTAPSPEEIIPGDTTWKRQLRTDSITLWRIVLWTAGLAPIVLASIALVLWIHSQIATWVYWKIALLLLVALEMIYGASVSMAVLGALCLGALWVMRTRGGSAAPRLALGFLVCCGLLFAAFAVEAACALARARSQKSTPPSVDWMQTRYGITSESRFRRPVLDYELPTRFSDPPGDRAIDLVVIGESSALGVPFDRLFSLAQILSWKLDEVIPGRPVLPLVLAYPGSTLEGQHKLLDELTRRPEIMVIYCGQAEIANRVPTTVDIPYYLDEHLPGTAQTLLTWLERSSAACGLLHDAQDHCRTGIPDVPETHRRLIDTRAYTLTEYTTVVLDLQRRLEKIVSYAEAIGALPILVAPASNDARLEPNRSFLPADTPRAVREAFERDFLEARRMERIDPKAAIERYRALLARQPRFAESHFRLAQLLEGKCQWESAYRHYVAARDLDGLPTRALTAFQNAYREVAARHDCIFIDLQSYFHQIGPFGMLDDDLFQDGMHLSMRGHIALAQAILTALHARRAFDWPKDSAVPFIDPTECCEHFDVHAGAWRYVCVWGIMFADIAARWRFDSSERKQKGNLYAKGVGRIDAGEAPESLGLPNIGLPAPIPVEASALAVARPVPDPARGLPPRWENRAPP
jgi:lysophospholipase L1-like esterase